MKFLESCCELFDKMRYNNAINQYLNFDKIPNYTTMAMEYMDIDKSQKNDTFVFDHERIYFCPFCGTELNKKKKEIEK